ncbi:MAG TPA: ABC transporter ATP-binding protein [Gallionellaceae bacterium]|nr:ABC transporter ATP-binding protein [Gallionellaceae bacterium]
MSAPITLSARNLNRRHGRRQIIRNVSLQLRRGEVLGLLGHNGAGKSTTMQLLTGTLIPDSGQIEICGHDLARQPARAKACIGYLPETPPLYRDMRVDDYLTFAARLHGMSKAAIAAALVEVKRRCGLQDAGQKIIGTLSKGYQQRVGIAQAIIHEPEVIILDEPTVGLDPTQIRDIRALIRELGSAHSVLLSTHLLSEAENICDRVEIMQHGQLIYGDTSVRMQRFGHQPGFMVTLQAPPPLAELQAISGVQSVEAMSSTRFKILHDANSNTASTLLQTAAERGWQAQQLTPLQGSMEDAFVQLTQQEPVQQS